jgi:hypothetical protein
LLGRFGLLLGRCAGGSAQGNQKQVFQHSEQPLQNERIATTKFERQVYARPYSTRRTRK